MKMKIHIHRSTDGSFEIIPSKPKEQRIAERSWARLAMYHLMGDPTDPQSVGIPLAPLRCDGIKCPPVPRMRTESNGGLQNQSVAPLVRIPARQASSIVRSYVPSHYHKFFCAHDIFRGLPCTSCRRDSEESREWI